MSFIPSFEKRASVHGRLHKYRSTSSLNELDQLLSMINKGSLWLYHLTGQNDERECTPICFFGGDRRHRYKFFKKDFKVTWPNADPNWIERSARSVSRSPIIPNSKKIYRNWAVCCFSIDEHSSRMWQEYACNYNGVIITYLADKSVSLGLAGKVIYSDRPVMLDIMDINEEKMYEIFTTKDLKWEYESEYRIIEKLDEPESGINKFYKDNKILSITIGRNVSSEYQHIICDLCEKKGILIK